MISKLTLRLLVFNLLLVFFPVGMLFYLDTYEKQLLTGMENAMVQQGRLLSAALRDSEQLKEDALRILKNLDGNQDARIRIVDVQGNLLADSSSPVLIPAVKSSEIQSGIKSISRSDAFYNEIPPSIREHWLYRLAVSPLNLIRRIVSEPAVPLVSAEYYSGSTQLMGPEIQAALEGRYGAYTRYSGGGQRSVNLYSALPVTVYGEVAGAVLITRSTYRILTDLYKLRLDMVRVFFLSIAAAAALSLVLARTITIPVKKLRDQAESFLDHRGRIMGSFRSLKNRDEIGDLSRSLDGLSRRLEDYMNFMDSFSADLSHELKNPVASILNAAELSRDADEQDRETFYKIIGKEGYRIQRLIDDLRSISRIDVQMGREKTEVIELGGLVRELVRQKNSTGQHFALEDCMGSLYIRGTEDRIIQCLLNLMDNAMSFSPPGEQVLLRLGRREDFAEITVLDRGPGIPEGNQSKIFKRFFTDRPESDGMHHSGLGLSIVQSIVQAYGGSINCTNRRDGGAAFCIMLPFQEKLIR